MLEPIGNFTTNPSHLLIPSLLSSVEYVWCAGRLLLDKYDLTTLNYKDIKQQADEWREKLMSWDKQRKKANMSIVQSMLEEADAALKSTEASVRQAASGKLFQTKESIERWIYFAKVHHYDVGTGIQELEQAVKDISARMESLK